MSQRVEWRPKVVSRAQRIKGSSLVPTVPRWVWKENQGFNGEGRYSENIRSDGGVRRREEVVGELSGWFPSPLLSRNLGCYLSRVPCFLNAPRDRGEKVGTRVRQMKQLEQVFYDVQHRPAEIHPGITREFIYSLFLPSLAKFLLDSSYKGKNEHHAIYFLLLFLLLLLLL